MKKLLILAVMAALSFWGCSESTSLTEPTDVQQQQSFLKVNTDNVSELSVEAKAALGVENVNTLSKSWLPSSTTKEVGDEGGNVRFLLADKGAYSLGKIGVDGSSFPGETDLTISMLDDEIATLDITSSVQLVGAVELTVCFIGVDVEVGDDVDFVYLDGKDDPDHSGIIVGNGWVVVVKAQLDHLSRFGFTK